jgi:integrase/recombinase XerD
LSKLREQMKMDLELKGYSSATQAAYLRGVQKFAEHYGQSPEWLGTDEIKGYLHHIITVSNAGNSTVDIAYSALKFLYEFTLSRQWDMKQIPRTKKPKKLPIILAPSEINSLFQAAKNPKHKALLMTIYGAGLRTSEATHLKVSDIDSANMQIRVRQAKGKKDRYTLLSENNLTILRWYWKCCRPSEWLFPGKTPDQPMNTRAVWSTFQQIKTRAQIQKKVSTHTLRHCFATHLLEAGASLYHIQQLMGHTNPRSTGIYIHLTRKDLFKVKSPLDTIEDFNHD